MADQADAVEEVLKAASGLTDLTGQRIWQDTLPAEQAAITWMPAVVVQQIPGPSIYAMGGQVGKVELQFQVDSYGRTRDSCNDVREQVLLALKEYSGTIVGVRLDVVGVMQGAPARVPDAKLWRCIQTYDIWGSE